MVVLNLTLQAAAVYARVHVTVFTEVVCLINLVFTDLPVGTDFKHVFTINGKRSPTNRLVVTCFYLRAVERIPQRCRPHDICIRSTDVILIFNPHDRHTHLTKQLVIVERNIGQYQTG